MRRLEGDLVGGQQASLGGVDSFLRAEVVSGVGSWLCLLSQLQS